VKFNKRSGMEVAMVCPDCGTRLTDSDQFCPGCGAKIIRKRRCPECGETLREGLKFCPGCGAEVSEERRVKRTGSEEPPKKKASPAPPPKKKTSAAPPPQKRKAPPKPRDWEEEDDDYDDEEESVDILSIMTVAVGCILLVILAVLGYNLYRRYMPKDYDKIAKEQEAEREEAEEDGQTEEPEGGQELTEDPGEDPGESEVTVGGTLVTTAAVNIRDNPSTDGTTVIKKANEGDSYEYTEAVEGGTWYQILLPEEPDYEYGYVYADYVEIQ